MAKSLNCCYSCEPCETCTETVVVDQYNSIIDMPIDCAYEYYLDSTCNCETSGCDTLGRLVDLCSFTNTTGNKLRQIIERKKAEGNYISKIETLKAEIIADVPVKNIEYTGLSSVVVSYEQDGEFKVAIICLEDVTCIIFAEETD